MQGPLAGAVYAARKRSYGYRQTERRLEAQVGSQRRARARSRLRAGSPLDRGARVLGDAVHFRDRLWGTLTVLCPWAVFPLASEAVYVMV